MSSNRLQQQDTLHFPSSEGFEFFEVLVTGSVALQQREPRLLEMTTNTTYDCLKVLLKSVGQAVVSTSHRAVLKNFCYWFGQITLSRNKPLKSKLFDLKNATLDAYEIGTLTAVLPLVCKVLEGVQKSKVYKLPSPWTTAITSLLAELHDVPNLQTNLMFEVEVLCKHLGIKISDLKKRALSGCGLLPSHGVTDENPIGRGYSFTSAEPISYRRCSSRNWRFRT